MDLLKDNKGLQKMLVKKLVSTFKANNNEKDICKLLDNLNHSPWEFDFDILEAEAEKNGFYFDIVLGTFLPEF